MNRFQSWYGMQPPAIRALLTINVVFYVLWLFLFGRIGPTIAFVEDHVQLSAWLPKLLYEPWQLVTYNFLHLDLGLNGLLHILFNMLWLVWIGREFEQMQGSHRLLAIYLISGIGGGLLTLAVYSIFPPAIPVVVYGASASVLGIMAAVATFYPYQSVGLLFIGNIRLAYLVIAFLAIDIIFFSELFGREGSVAVWAHVGGALFGFLFAYGEKSGLNLSGWARIFFRSGGRSRRRVAPTPRRENVFGKVENWLGSRQAAGETKSRPATVHPMRSAPAPAEKKIPSEREVDRILDKISSNGYESLSEEEKRFLYEASRR